MNLLDLSHLTDADWNLRLGLTICGGAMAMCLWLMVDAWLTRRGR